MKVKLLAVVLVLGGLFVGVGIVYACGNEDPVAILTTESEDVVTGVEVLFDGTGSYDPDGSGGINGIIKFEWDFSYDQEQGFQRDRWENPAYQDDGEFDGKTTYTYSTAGQYKVALRVTDEWPATAIDADSVTLTVQKVFYVDIDAEEGEEDGSIWADAYITIASAISAADPGDEIWVAEGIYGLSSELTVNEAVDIYGGFQGVETQRSQRDWRANVTTVDGGGTVRCFYIGDDCTIDGFTITNGYYNGNGGGIYCNSASPEITNCTISENSAEDKGGGMYNYNSDPSVTNCIFSKNSAHDVEFHYGGGGMYNNDSSPSLINCVFSKNLAEGDGGAMYNYGNSSDPDIINCSFNGNYAKYYGGAMCNGGDSANSDPVITNCIFWGNSAEQGGSEIYNYTGANPTVTHSCIKGWTLGGTGNTNEDSKFVNAGYPAGPDGIFGTIDDGLRVRTDSPCVDKGNDAEVPETVTTDITGAARIVDGDHQITDPDTDNPTVDMGAYELPTIWYVYGDVTGGDDNGTSWTDAYDDLQDALTNEDIGDGNEIWVAEGTYYPYEGIEPEEHRSETFQLVEGVAVYGGFAGTETAREDRNWANNQTILSGDIDSCGSEDSYHVVTGADNAILDGFRITGGNADGSSPDNRGGGIYCDEVSPVIRNCVITGNNASGFGGGMYSSSSSGVVMNCFFSGNTAGHGGGVSNSSGELTLTNCVFVLNIAAAHGGGIYNDFSSATIINCTFYDNKAGETRGKGGGICNGSSSPTITNCILWGNSAYEGDEIHNSVSSSPAVTYSYVEGGYEGEGNIDGVSDPFADADDADGSDDKFGTLDDGLRIEDNSLCIDAGNNNAISLSKDIIGCNRKIDDPLTTDSGNGTKPIVDMGAYEYQTFPRLRISGGEDHTLVIKADYTAWACGRNDEGQLGNDEYPDGTYSLVQVKDETGGDYLKDVIEIDAGWLHSLAVDMSENGYVWAWGKNTQGQIGDESPLDTVRETPVKVHKGDMVCTDTYLEDIVKVAAGRSGEYSLARDKSGYAWAWGKNDKGQLGNGETGGNELDPVWVLKGEMVGPETYLENIIDIDAGIDHSIALDDTLDNGGYVWCWGYNYFGQLGNNDKGTDSDEPVRVHGGEMGTEHLENIVDVAVSCGLWPGSGNGSSYAVDSSGYVWAWGYNRYGELGNGESGIGKEKVTPVQVKKGEQPVEGTYLKNIVAISAGNHHVLALDKNGYVWAWGQNYEGQLGNGGEDTTKDTPVRVKIDGDTPLADIVYIDAGFEHSTAIDSNGNFWVWGDNRYGKLGLGEDLRVRTYAEQMP